MNAATEFDVGPLTWVKSEIDLALERADNALQQYTNGLAAGAGDLTQIKFGRTHLHQVQGALTIVGLDGVTQFAEAVESLLDDLEQQRCPPSEAAIALAQQSLTVIAGYLDDLIGGQPNQPLRLLPLYREVQRARGVDKVSASDLFFPDLNVRPPRRQSPARKLLPTEFLALLRQERARFQRGLLAWLRSPRDPKGIGEMLEAVRHIEETQDAPSARAFWWVAIGFFSALSDGALADDTNSVKQLCARIDLQIRRLLEGSKNVAERLVRDVLYFVALADSNHPVVQQVRNVYQLQAVLPGADASGSTADDSAQTLQTLRRRLGELISSAEEAWSKYCMGSIQSLPLFKRHAGALIEAVAELENTDFRRLAQAIGAAAQWLSEDSSRHSDALSMEVATAILFARNAQEHFPQLGRDFAHQVDVTVARVHACLAGSPPQPESEVPLLDEMSRQAQEKLLIGQVAKEIQSNFAQIEQVLDGFFRDVGKRADLTGLEVPFRQVAGALTMMRHDAAAAAVTHCSDEIKRFSDARYETQESDFENVANQLSMIGFFIDSLQHGTVDFVSFARQMESSSAPGINDSEGADGDTPQVSVEQEVEEHKRAAYALLDALRAQPDDAGLRAGLKQTLSALKNDADLLADKVLGDQAKAVIAALGAGEHAGLQVEQANEILRPRVTELSPPTASTPQGSPAHDEEVDAELLGIFLEEAHEVLASVDANLELLMAQPHNVDCLSSTRRSFHTLKGSGRMVGLKDVGEAAWSIEQTLNLWLGQEMDASPRLCDLLGEAYALFSVWIHHLETRSGETPDAGPLIALSDALRRDIDAQREPRPASDFELEATDEQAATDDTAAVPEIRLVDSLPTAGVPKQSAEVIAFNRLALPEEGSSVQAEAGPIDHFEPVEIDALGFEPAVQEEAPETVEEKHGIAAQGGDTESPATKIDPVAAQKVTISPLLFEIFSEEARTHVATLEHELAKLERQESSPTPHEMYRAAHTLAGISATVGLLSINRLGLALEHALLRRDNSTHPESLEALGVIRQAVGELGLVLASLADQREPVVRQGLIESLEDVYPASSAATATATAASESVAEADVVADDAAVPHIASTPDAVTEHAGAMAQSEPQAQAPQLQDEIDEQLLPIFLEEALELNQTIAGQLRAWRSAPGNAEIVRTLTRLLHTLKGSARMAGAMNLGELTHSMETRVDQASHSGDAPLAVIDAIDNDFDAVLQYVDQLQHREPLDQSAPAPSAQEVVSPAASPPGEVAEAAAPAVEKRADPVRVAAREFEGDMASATLRVRADLIDRLVNEAGELSISRSRIEGEMRSLKESLLDLTENVIRLRRQLREIEIQAESQMQSRTAQADERHAGFDPLEFDRFTRFQELTRMMAESVNDVGTVQQNLLKNLDDANAAIIAQARLNREVQQELMAVRMMPFGSLGDRLYRIVRQTSKELNKRVNLELSGTQVELDRSVLDKISAPLEHMLRNAIVHGIETREMRRTRGKPEAGEITLGVKREGNEIILSFADDGGGLDFARIRARAIEGGLLTADEAAEELDYARLADMIFAPGFTTASALSQVAGRGVGMDVVKTEISRLGGRIEVISTAGKGTEFRLYIPLTLAVTKALLIRAGNRKYAIPSVMIEQVLDLKEAALSRIRNAGAAEWMGHRYPFSYLPQLLGDTQAVPEQHRQYWTLLLKSGTRRIAVQVDQLLGNQEIVVKNIGPQLIRVVGVDGATVLGNGDVVLILNPVALSSRVAVTEYVAPAPAAPVRAQGEATVARLPTVMVVDDSLTVRKITGRLLAREGYQVILAKDGVDALEHLLEVIPDVMLVDIEMPRMDGFDLTRNIRADAHLSAIPIIMITSRTADKHRSYAFEIGANHYLGKPYQEDELLQLVAGYVTRQRGA